ncbi:hypothetical protein DFP74_0047 [Nocardiopsis sp. Huas11]|uniref:hypothetical protein n=1 Tax=Nocardiopsis sp. Huas11 TaxID=2183912 RepID=UPI000EB10469|nr:hypothetical protein [Nocardiopsis sp. Huas11]RKS04489.1 hypothetical protein DFP74_0047 [Nocardiopsis sp. Huas11]
MPGSVIAAVTLMGIGALLGLGYALLFGVIALISVLNEEAGQAFRADLAGSGPAGAVLLRLALLSFTGLAYAAASVTVAVRSRRRVPATPRAIVVVQVLGPISFVLTVWTLFLDAYTVSYAGIVGLYGAAIAVLVLTPSARRYYRSDAAPGPSDRRAQDRASPPRDARGGQRR